MSLAHDEPTEQGACPHFCPNCLEGEVWATCATCAGRGQVDAGDPPCPTCEGGGEVLDPNPCAVCGATGQVTLGFLRLFEADRHARRSDPGWKGDPWQHEGATIYSIAAYYRQRGELRERVVRVAGRSDPTDSLWGVVYLYGGGGAQLASYPGFAWGYGGEGPCGLAAVLADLFPSRFPDLDDALRFVGSQRKGQEWEVAG